MATSSTPTAAGTTITAQSTAASTAAFQVAGPRGLVHKNPLLNNWVRTRPVLLKVHVQNRNTALSRTFPASSITAAQPYTAVPQPYNAAAQLYNAAVQPYIAPYNNMPAMSARPTEPMGYFGQGGQLPFMLTQEQLLQQQQLLREKQECGLES